MNNRWFPDMTLCSARMDDYDFCRNSMHRIERSVTLLLAVWSSRETWDTCRTGRPRRLRDCPRLTAQLRRADPALAGLPPEPPTDGECQQAERDKVRLLEPPEVHWVKSHEGDRELAHCVQPQVQRKELAIGRDALAQPPDNREH